MKVLAIETSCDETAIAIANFSGTRKKPEISVLSNLISSQVKLHARFGGVVPNLARREHEKNLVPMLLQALRESGIQNLESRSERPRGKKHVLGSKFQILDSILERESELLGQFLKYIVPLPVPDIDAIAVTHGPGLAPALWVGVNFANALSMLWKKPLIPVNHMEGHLYSAFLQKSGVSYQLSIINYPAIALLVSGGHTELVLTKGHGKYKIIGETLDDAAGEAFDKVARILGLNYPGGPEMSRLAEKKKSYEVQPHKISLPRPMINSRDYNFSFSGLKTAVLYLARDLGKAKTRKFRAEIAKEFQDAVVEVLVKKTIRAAKQYKVKTVLLGGGVAANKLLRARLAIEIKENLPATTYQLPALFMTGDNALMITLAAFLSKKRPTYTHIRADANLRLDK